MIVTIFTLFVLGSRFWDEIGKLDRIPDEENRRIVFDHIPVSFFRVEFQRKVPETSGGVFSHYP